MVTIYRESGLRFFFYSNEYVPAHVHVERDGGEAKFNLIGASGSPELVSVDGLKRADVRRAMEILEANCDLFLARWIEIHG